MKNINFMSDEMINNIFLPNDDVLAEYEISGEFSEKILKSMGERRKKNEEKAQQKEKIHKNTFIRAAVIAAVITLMILVIPSSRQVVVNAAESVWEWLVKSNGSYSYEFDTIEFNPEISDKDYSYDCIKLGSVNQTIKVGCLDYEFADLNIKKDTDLNFPDNHKTGLIIDVKITHDDTIEYMPSFSNYVSLVGLKNDEVVFTCAFGDGCEDYYWNVTNGTNMEYYNENGERIPAPYRYDENDIRTYIEDKTKYPWYPKTVTVPYEADFWYFNFDKFGNEGDRDKFEQYKNELFTTFNSDGYNEYVIEMIKKIKPDTYKICQLDAYIIECDDVSRYPVCDQYRTGYNFHSEDYEKYRKYFNEF